MRARSSSVSVHAVSGWPATPPTTPSTPHKVTHEYYIFGGEGRGKGDATPLCVPRDVRHELLIRVLPAREGRVVLDQVPEEDRLPLRVALADDLQS